MKRFNPFDGMQVSLQDLTYWTIETASAVKQRINSDLYNSGVVNGLTTFESGTISGYAAATPGVAYDANGERIAPRLLDLISYNGARINNGAQYQIALRYFEGNDGTSGLDVAGLSNFRHVTDSFSVIVAKSGADSLLADDVVLAKVFSAVAGSSLIFDSSVRDVFSAKFAGTTTNLQAANVSIGGSLVVGGCITSLLGGSFYSEFVGAGGLSVSGPVCFFSSLVALCDAQFKGDAYFPASKGPILTSPDGTKKARVGIDNNGFITQEPLNYTLA